MDVVYFKLKSAKDFRCVPVDGPFISVPELKAKIVYSDCYGHGKDFDLLMSDAVTGRDYDEWALIPRGSSVSIRRIPGWPQKPIVVSNSTDKNKNDAQETPLPVSSPDDVVKEEEPDYIDLGPEVLPEHKEISISERGQQTESMEKLEEDAKIKLLVNTPALEGYQRGGFVSAKSSRSSSWRSKGCRVLEPKTPPLGYVCRRCQEPGHFIQHCPTNGDRAYDIKLKPITGIPKSMLVASSNGLYQLPSGATAIFKPNESAFDKEMEGIASRNHVGYLPPELFCPLCKKVMKDAVLSSKCCLDSFCDKCIRDHIISKSMCYCGTRNVLADDLIPNRTLRETVHAMLIAKSTSSSSGDVSSSITDGGPVVNVSHNPSPVTFTATSKSQQDASSMEDPLVAKKDEWKVEEHAEGKKLQQKILIEESTLKEKNSSEDAVHGIVIDGNKKRKKKAGFADTASSMCTRAYDPGMEYCPQFQFAPATYYPLPAAAMPLGFDAYTSYFAGGVPCMNYAQGSYVTDLCGIPWQSQYGAQSYNVGSYREPWEDDMINKEARSFKDAPLVKSKNEFKSKCHTPPNRATRSAYDDESGITKKRRKLPCSHAGYVHGRGRS